jgi:hypothetical protein
MKGHPADDSAVTVPRSFAPPIHRVNGTDRNLEFQILEQLV